ncbi:Rad2 family nuclease [Martiniozyma asiatica (nom. inval.)]|nr:Rad2 family nuclease [Martiniozyma asiatica]
MGVTGLLPVLKPIQENVSLERYRGKTVAIDTYSWLHKSVFSCADKIVKDEHTDKYWSYFKKKLDMFRHFGVTPYFVLDGDYLPRKGATEEARHQKRTEAKEQALEAQSFGNVKLAWSCFQKACDITPEIAKSCIEHFKKLNIKYVVAPYEADSQMVLLEQLGLVDAIISEDSDLMIFGAKILLTKLKDDGTMIEIKRENFKRIHNSKICLFNDDQLLLMAALSGCDYTKGIPGYGIKKAITLVHNYPTYERALMAIRVDGKVIPTSFEEEYKMAKIAFRHQIVFNPLINAAQHLNPLTDQIISQYGMEYIYSCTGQITNQDIHFKIAIGDLNPHTKEILVTRECFIGYSDSAKAAKRTNTMPEYNSEKPKLASRSSTMQPTKNLSYRSNKPVARTKRALLTIDDFITKMKKENSKSDENNNNTETIKIKSASSTLSVTKLTPTKEAKTPKSIVYHPPPVLLSPTAKRQKRLLNANVGESQKLTEKSKFFKKGMKKQTLEILRKEKSQSHSIDASNFMATSSDIDESIEFTEDEIKQSNNSFQMKPIIEENSINEQSFDLRMSSTSTIKDLSQSKQSSYDEFLDEISECEIDEKTDNKISNFKSVGSCSTPKTDRVIDLPDMNLTLNNANCIKIIDIQTDLSLNSVESGTSTDSGVGEQNVDYILDCDDSDEVDKNNLLNEIYSFRKPIASQNKLYSVPSENWVNMTNKKLSITGNKPIRSSLLASSTRKPLTDKTNNVFNSNKNKSNQRQLNLSQFRYTEN